MRFSPLGASKSNRLTEKTANSFQHKKSNLLPDVVMSNEDDYPSGNRQLGPNQPLDRRGVATNLTLKVCPGPGNSKSQWRIVMINDTKDLVRRVWSRLSAALVLACSLGLTASAQSVK